MTKREIVLDDESDRVLESLAKDWGGDVSAAIRDLLHVAGGAGPGGPDTRAWQRLTMEQFAAGYSPEDAIYDKI